MTAGPVALDPGARRWLPAGVRLPASVFGVALVLALGAGGAPAVWAQAAAVDSTAAAGVAAVPVVPAVPAVAAPDSLAAAGTDSARAPALPADLKRQVKAKAAAGEPKVDLWDTGVSATGAVLMTPLFPGWGQLYAGGGWRAALAFGTEMYFWSNLLARDRQERRDRDFAATLEPNSPDLVFVEALAAEHRAQMQDFVWWSGGALLIIALDAYVGAHLFNFDRDPVPVPDHWQDVFGPVGAGSAALAPAGPEVTVFQWRKGF
jgi:hypothetical protein